jgi:hypothetical protein
MNERYISTVPALGNNLMYMHDVFTFKAMQFAPLLNNF